jgi:hypothetical protein
MHLPPKIPAPAQDIPHKRRRVEMNEWEEIGEEGQEFKKPRTGECPSS